jgi:hypothetical protein
MYFGKQPAHHGLQLPAILVIAIGLVGVFLFGLFSLDNGLCLQIPARPVLWLLDLSLKKCFV